MRQEQPGAGEPLRPHAFREQIPFEPSAASERFGAAMRAVNAELMSGGAGGRLVAESLANVLAVHLIRYVSELRRRRRRVDGELPPAKLRAVVESIEGQLEAGPTLGQMAAFAHLSTYHFARQFKAATGLPPREDARGRPFAVRLATRAARGDPDRHGVGDRAWRIW